MSSLDAPRSTARRPSRRRLLGAAVLALPVLELVGLLVVGQAIGAPATLLLLLAGVVVGVIVLRRAGAAATRGVLTRPSAYASEASTPPNGSDGPLVGTPVGTGTPPPAATALLALGGLLLLVPGFLSDVAGLVLLVPAARRAIAARVGEAVRRRAQVRTVRLDAGQVIPGEVIVNPSDVRVTEVRVIEPPKP